MSTIGIELRIGSEDTGATVVTAEFSAFYTFNIQVENQPSQRILLNQFLKSLRTLRLNPTATALDLLALACAAYAADTKINRYKNSDDGWTRQFHLFVPVHNPALWEPHQSLVTHILNFLTGDLWRVTFRQSAASIVIRRRKLKPSEYHTDTVCLFSGGMDSFIGAMKLLDEGKRPLLVGHAKSSEVSDFRNQAADALKKRYTTLDPKLINAFVRVEKVYDGEEDPIEGENTERGRSFLFLALGVVCASGLPYSETGSSRRSLYIPENGFITLNIPLTPLRIGAYSTRTTHPYYLGVMQQLVNAIDLKIDIINPFEFKTKGEMLMESQDPEFVTSVNTMSCSRPATRNAKLEGKGKRHCGRCVPCLIRCAALHAAKVSDDNRTLPEERKYRTDIFHERLHASTRNVDNKSAKGEHVMAFRYMIERNRQNPNYLKAAIHLTGPLDEPAQSLAVYLRGLKEVEAILENVEVVD
ncbi:hypothetical protein GCM10023187_53920 [Nibrella viscosa]|uniref:7-cyano-7-deazaguanine synthase (Queuosine biosynthesis) n=1 Tax=Nibrella viscosa TaxID=1084524 RepID=A0ABP8KZ20_9BACT